MITSVGIDGQPVGTTANAASSLSLDPPLILVCFDRSRRTLEAVLAHGAFATLECSAERRLDGGDHEIIMGRVRVVEAR